MDFNGVQTVQGPNESFSAASKEARTFELLYKFTPRVITEIAIKIYLDL